LPRDANIPPEERRLLTKRGKKGEKGNDKKTTERTTKKTLSRRGTLYYSIR